MSDAIESNAWQEAFDRHAANLILFARQWCRSHADAEDAVQEGFIRGWRAGQSVRDMAAYLYTCVKHAALDQQRGEGRRVVREQAIAHERQTGNVESAFEADELERERVRMVERHLADLPDEQREVLVMKVWGGLTFTQIGEALDIPMNTAASRYRYALQAMRQLMPREQVQ